MFVLLCFRSLLDIFFKNNVVVSFLNCQERWNGNVVKQRIIHSQFLHGINRLWKLARLNIVSVALSATGLILSSKSLKNKEVTIPVFLVALVVKSFVCLLSRKFHDTLVFREKIISRDLSSP